MPLHHPVAWAVAGSVAIAGTNRAKWSKGTARVRHLESSPEGLLLVEMDDDNVFVAASTPDALRKHAERLAHARGIAEKDFEAATLFLFAGQQPIFRRFPVFCHAERLLRRFALCCNRSLQHSAPSPELYPFEPQAPDRAAMRFPVVTVRT